MRRPLLPLLLGLLLLQQGRCFLEFVIHEETVSQPALHSTAFQASALLGLTKLTDCFNQSTSNQITCNQITCDQVKSTKLSCDVSIFLLESVFFPRFFG